MGRGKRHLSPLDAAQQVEVLANVGLARKAAARYFRKLRPSDHADILSEAYLGLCEAVASAYPRPGTIPLGAWLAIKIDFVLREFVRTQRRPLGFRQPKSLGLRPVSVPVTSLDEEGAGFAVEADSIKCVDARDLIITWIDRLEPDEQQAVWAVYIEGRTIASSRLWAHRAPSIIGKRLSRARAKLKQLEGEA